MEILGAPALDGPQARAIRVLLFERTGLLRGALTVVLSAEGDLDVAAVATIPELLSAARPVRPNVTVIDIHQLAYAGYHVLDDLAAVAPGGRTLVLADAASPTTLRAALDRNVRGLIDRDAPHGRLADCIRRVARGERVVDPGLSIVAQRAPDNPFTPRERDVLAAVALGLPSADIAARLRLSSGTVDNHVSSILRKTGTRNRSEAVHVAGDAGWVRIPGRPHSW